MKMFTLYCLDLCGVDTYYKLMYCRTKTTMILESFFIVNMCNKDHLCNVNFNMKNTDAVTYAVCGFKIE